MAIEITVKTRDEAKADYLRSVKIRNPDADVGPGTQPDIDAATLADQLVPVYAAAQTISRAVLLREASGSDLDDRGAQRGLIRGEAKGAAGFVIIEAAASGGTILEDAPLIEPNTRVRFRCALTGFYANGSLCPVVGLDTGPGTNLEAGTVLQWESPPPGIGQFATVYEQTDGSGLKGGADVESDEDFRARIYAAEQDPPASGNVAEYIKHVKETPGIPVEAVFAYPAIFGPGTISVVFTVRPDEVGASRIPNSTQIAEAEAYVTGRMPEDDSAFFAALVAQNVDIALEIEWADGAAGWVDVVPWPPRYEAAGTPGKVVIGSVTDSTHFTIATANADYTGIVAPSAGNTIGLYDQTTRRFWRKKILSVAGTGPWTIVVDTAENASDTSYTPVGSQPVVPWSDSLDSLVAPVLDYFKGLGPGEQMAGPFDAGTRQRRSPKAPREWPNVISNRLLDEVFDLTTVADAVLAEGLGQTTTIGTPGSVSNLLTLRYLSAYAP